MRAMSSPYPPEPAPQPYGGGPAPHPSAQTSVVLGVTGLVGTVFCCGLTLVVSPFAWIIGGRAVREIDAEPQRWSGRDQAQIGKITGIVGTVLLVLAVLALAVVIAVFVAGGASFVEEMSSEMTSSDIADL